MAFIYDLSDTWNNAGISWNGVKLNVTDTASAVGSKLLDLQIGGASKFTVGKTGSVIATGNIHSTSGGFTFPDGTTQITRAVTNVTATDGSIAITGTTDVNLSVVSAPKSYAATTTVRNNSGATLTKGTAVYINGAVGQNPTVTKAIASGDATSAQTLGLIATDISNNANGEVILIGTLYNINTSAYADGEQLYLSPTTAGTLTATKPYAPSHLVYMAIVEHAHPTQGKLFVKVQNGYEMEELHDVSARNPANNDGLFYNTSTNLWEKKSIVTALGYTPYNATNPAGYTTNVGTVTSVAGTGTVNGLTLTGSVTTSGSLTLGGTLGNIANSQLTNSAITINGTSTALGGSISVGTVTSVAALTLGTSGTDLASSVANGTTTPVITLNVPTASAANRGALSSSDWSTFNAKQAALVSGTNIKTVGGASLLGSGDVGTIGLAYGGTGATTAPGARTALGLGTAAVLNAGVAGGVATLDGSGTVPTSQLPGAVLGGLNYQGTWNASTNTPTLASSTGSKGHYYVVSVAGSTNLDGITDWKIGDWAVYDGTTWQKVDNTDAVSSVNSFTGAVVLTTSDVAQGTNLYFTQAAARGSVSAGTGISYNSTSGVITNSAPDQTVALTGAGTTVVTGTYPNFTITSNDSTVGTVTSVAASGGTTGLSFTGSPITTAGTLTLAGTLGVANGGTGATTLSSGYLVKGNGTSAVSASVVYDNGTDVGIGTASPSGYKTRILGGNDNTLLIDNDGSQYTSAWFANNGTTKAVLGYNNGTSNFAVLNTTTSGNLLLGTVGAERMRIDSSGNVGIGVTPNTWASGTTALQVKGINLYSFTGVNNFLTSNAYYDGIAWKYQGGGNAAQYQLQNAEHIWYAAASGATGGAISWLERMRIDLNGNVGIGTSSPAAKLHVFNASGSSSLYLQNGASTRTWKLDSFSDGNMYVGIPGVVDSMTFAPSGNVGIGTSSPLAKFNVEGGNVLLRGGVIDIGPTAGADGAGRISTVRGGDGVSGNLIFSTQNSSAAMVEAMRIDGSGNLGVGVTPLANTRLYVRTAAVTDTAYLADNGANSGFKVQFASSTTSILNDFNAALVLGTNNTERMRINSVGDVAVGTSSPGTKFHTVGGNVWSSNFFEVGRFQKASGTGITLGYDNSAYVATIGAYSHDGTASNLAFWTYPGSGSATERMRIDLNGNVGIGTSSPAQRLTVVGNILTNSAAGSDSYINITTTGIQNTLLGFNNSGTTNAYGALNNSTYVGSGNSYRVQIVTNGSAAVTVQNDLNVGIGTSSPVSRLNVSGTTGFTWPDGGGTSSGLVTIGTQGTGGSLFVNTASLNTGFASGLAIDGTYSHPSSVVNIKAVGVKSGGSYNASLAFHTSFETTLTERMRIDASGNVGIGYSLPRSVASYRTLALGGTSNGGLLDMVNGSGSVLGTWYSDSTGSLTINADPNGAFASSNIMFQVDGTERARIDSSGNLIVSNGQVNSKNTALFFGDGADNSASVYATGGPVKFFANASERMRLTSAGNLIINESAQVAYGGNTPKLEILSASIESTDADGGSLALIGSTNTAGAGGALVLGSLFTSGAPSAWGTFARVRASKDTSTAGEYGGGLAFDTRPNLGVLTQRMLITSAGNVGIGTSSPGAKLDVNGGNANTEVRFNHADNVVGRTVTLRMASTSNASYTGAGAYVQAIQGAGVDVYSLAFGTTQGSTSATERMRIDSSGNLLVGTTSATLGDNYSFSFLTANAGQLNIAHATGSGTGYGYLLFGYAGAAIGSISQNGTTGVLYNTSSDVRLKDNITDADDAASLIDAIQVRKFDWKADGSHQRYGFVAQELVTVAPEAVSQPENPDDMMGVDYSKLVPMLVKEIQSMRLRLAQLEGN